MFIDNKTQVYGDGKSLAIFTDDRGMLLHDYAASSLCVSMEPSAERCWAETNSLYTSRYRTTVSLEIQSCGKFDLLFDEAAQKARSRLASAWDLPVDELLKIVYNKLDQREED